MTAFRVAAGTALVTIVTVGASTFTAAAAATPASTASRAGAPSVALHTAVLGYIGSGDGLAALRRNLPGLTSVGLDGVNISASGATVSRPDRNARAMLTVTHQAGKTAELLVGNFNDAIGDFDPAAAHRLFVSARHPNPNLS